MGVRPIILGQQLRKTPAQAKRPKLGCKFNDQNRISKAAKCLGTIKPACDEQEWDSRRQPQHESKDICATALGERLNVFFFGSGCGQM